MRPSVSAHRHRGRDNGRSGSHAHAVWPAHACLACGDHRRPAARACGGEVPVAAEVQRNERAQARGQSDPRTGRTERELRCWRTFASPHRMFAAPDRLRAIRDRESGICELFSLAHDLARTSSSQLRRSLAGDGQHTIANEMMKVAVQGLHRIEFAVSEGGSSPPRSNSAIAASRFCRRSASRSAIPRCRSRSCTHVSQTRHRIVRRLIADLLSHLRPQGPAEQAGDGLVRAEACRPPGRPPPSATGISTPRRRASATSPCAVSALFRDLPPEASARLAPRPSRSPKRSCAIAPRRR